LYIITVIKEKHTTIKGNKMRKIKTTTNTTVKRTNRDGNIQMHLTGQISLSTRTIKDKTKYTRKEKHRARY